jgi:hypothetical protein
MRAFDSNTLWAKSKVFIERGLAARDQRDVATFHLWAALALELLGKSALARIHPVLVADPTKFDSILVACGMDVTDKTRSIVAKTTFERLIQVSREFDDRAERFCMLMANRRNEELHSGSSPTEDLDPRAWVPEYWRVTEIMSRLAARTLEDWVGADEAGRAREVISDASRTVATAVAARIARCKAEFDRRYPPGSADRQVVVEMANKSYLPVGRREIVAKYDDSTRYTCPACGANGWLFGDEVGSHMQPIEFDEDDPESALQFEDVTFETEAFVCTSCSLNLDGRLELDAAGMPQEYEVEREVEPDFEAEYGNE